MDLVTFTMLCALRGSTILTPCSGVGLDNVPSTSNPVRTVPQPVTTTRQARTSTATRLALWGPHIAAAAQRFAIPQDWIRAVMRAESAGQITLNGHPITSSVGAMGLMQVMPGTYQDMRAQYGLGPDPYDPHDNIFAGAAYLRGLYRRYGYPYAFAAYQAGPKRLDDYLLYGKVLPDSTRAYLDRIIPGGGIAVPHGSQGEKNLLSKGVSSTDIHGVKARADTLFFVRYDHFQARDPLVQTRPEMPKPPVSGSQPIPLGSGPLFVEPLQGAR